MITLWTAMATKHDPSASGIHWPRYGERYQLLFMDTNSLHVDTYEESICQNWKYVLEVSVHQ